MKSAKKVVVLLSAGLDSTVNAYEAIKHHHEVVLALTFNYGQRAAKKEIESAAKIAAHLKIPHKVVDLPWFKDFNKSSLLVEDQEVPTGDKVLIDNLECSQDTAKSVWVPNRNGIFLNIAAAYAEALGAHTVIPGFNAEEAVTFPDNSREFMEQATRSLNFSTSNHVTVGCYTIHMKKPDIVRLGQGLKIPWELIWPCYFNGDKWCGQCESCQRSKRAFASASIDVQHLFKEEIMQVYFIEKKFPYDGTQLHSLYAYLNHGILGPSVVSWQGACSISFEHMVDGEDLLQKAVIQGDEMLHFVMEVFDRDLFSGVMLQRIFASIAKDYLQENAGDILGGKSLRRVGDDIYLEDRKLSISIATRSPMSVLVHFAMNVTNKGTPVKTLSLQDLKLDPRKVSEDLMALLKKEFEDVLIATQKVRPVP